MNDELKQKLLHYLDVLEEGASKGGEFIAEQAPETVRQWITFSIVERAVLCSFGAVLIFLGCRYGKRLFVAAPSWVSEKSYSAHADKAFLRVIVCVAGAAFCIAGTIMFMVNLNGLILAWLAPNVFIIRELSALVK